MRRFYRGSNVGIAMVAIAIAGRRERKFLHLENEGFYWFGRIGRISPRG